MSDRPPDLDSDWSEEELLLLRSAEDDRPSSRALAATLAAVGLGAASSAATTAAASTAAAASTSGVGAGATAAKWGGAIAVTKWVSIVALGGAVAVTGVVVERHASQKTHAPAASKRPRARALVSRATTTPVNERSGAAAPTPAAENSPIAPAAIRPPHLAPPKRKETSAPSQPDLSREIAIIDDARTALRSARARDALTVLDRYDAELAKSGSLQLEAAALRIEALFRLGDRGRAQSLASAFLAKHSTSPYAARIRALVASDSAAP